MKRVFFLVALFCLSLVPSTTYACSCLISDPAMEFNRARAVFVGRVLGGTERVTFDDREDDGHVHVAGRVRFAVEESFKGEAAGVITLDVASMKNTSCGTYSLRRGTSYVVYAYADKEGKRLHTGVCTRTAAADSEPAREDLNFLRNLPPPGSGGGIRGKVWAALGDEKETPLAGVKVSAAGPDSQTHTALTDAGGLFEFARLKPGTYTVTPELPPQYTAAIKSVEVEIEDRGRAYAGFETYAAGTVSGRLADAAGRGFNAAFFALVGDGRRITGYSIDKNGGFKIEGVPPGVYHLFVEPRGPGPNASKNYYYPGTFRRDEATPVRMTAGEKVEGLEFRLPAATGVGFVEGRVVRKDGRPAAGVEVLLLCPRAAAPEGLIFDYGPTRAVTDEQGRFRLEGLTDVSYQLEARGPSEPDASGGRTLMHSPRLSLSPAAEPREVELVLSGVGLKTTCER